MSDTMNPPPRAREKKASTFSMRLTRSIRDDLEAVAARQERPVSDIIEDCIERSLSDIARQDELGAEVSSALTALANHAREVSREIGKPEENVVARLALVEGWRHLIERAVRFTPAGDDFVELRRSEHRVATAATALLRTLESVSEADPLMTALHEAQATAAVIGMFGGEPFEAMPRTVTGPSLFSEIEELAEQGGYSSFNLQDRLRSVLALGLNTAREELEELLGSLIAHEQASQTFLRNYEAAEQRGRDLVAKTGAPLSRTALRRSRA